MKAYVKNAKIKQILILAEQAARLGCRENLDTMLDRFYSIASDLDKAELEAKARDKGLEL